MVSVMCHAPSDYVGETAARAREPPVAAEEDDEGEEREVEQTAPIGRRAFEQDAAVAAHERRERVRVDEGMITHGYGRLRVDDRRQKHPRDQEERERLPRVAQENAERCD